MDQGTSFLIVVVIVVGGIYWGLRALRRKSLMDKYGDPILVDRLMRREIWENSKFEIRKSNEWNRGGSERAFQANDKFFEFLISRFEFFSHPSFLLMQIETFKIFRDLAESGSFSRTAVTNGITQSAVSQQIRALASNTSAQRSRVAP